MTLFYSNIESAVVNNGFVTKCHVKVWYEAVLSRHTFSSCHAAEILSNKIRQNKDITGITAFGKEVKITQFADDTSPFFCSENGTRF